MNGLVRNTAASLSRRLDGSLSRRFDGSLSRRFDVYEPLDRVTMRSASRHDRIARRRSASFKRKNKVPHFPLRTDEDRTKQKRQIFLNSYKFESADKLERSKCLKLNKVAYKVKSAVVKLVSSVFRIGAFRRSCNCSLAVRASSPTPRKH